jgi:hypothetical protein
MLSKGMSCNSREWSLPRACRRAYSKEGNRFGSLGLEVRGIEFYSCPLAMLSNAVLLYHIVNNHGST